MKRLLLFIYLYAISYASSQSVTSGKARDEPFVFLHGKKPRYRKFLKHLIIRSKFNIYSLHANRSIVDSHPNGSARTCVHEKEILHWLPKEYVV